MASPLSPWTLIATGPGNQEIFRSPLRVGVPVTIGRAPDSTVMLGVITIARNHGRIELVNGLPVYFNEPGAKGTLVDGDPVEGSTPIGERTLLEIGQFRFTLQRARAAAPPPREPAPSWSEPAPGEGPTLLDRQIQGVRMHRTESQKEAEAKSVRWERDWQELVVQARTIQARYGRHPRMLHFVVSKDEREVNIKLKEESPRGYTYFILSRVHPDGKYPELQAVWLREVGREDMSFSEPARALEELFSRVAPRLA
jgi:hypothetical protein